MHRDIAPAEGRRSAGALVGPLAIHLEGQPSPYPQRSASFIEQPAG
jgi:hypothetical protein